MSGCCTRPLPRSLAGGYPASRGLTDWLYHQYGAGQSFLLASMDIAIEVRQLYRRPSIPALVEQVEEEGDMRE